jgi:hypothetical protein
MGVGESTSFAVLHSRVTALSRKQNGSKAISPPAEVFSKRLWSGRLEEICDPFAIRLLAYHCLLRTFLPSVALHVIEFRFPCGFDSHTLPPIFNNL